MQFSRQWARAGCCSLQRATRCERTHRHRACCSAPLRRGRGRRRPPHHHLAAHPGSEACAGCAGWVRSIGLAPTEPPAGFGSVRVNGLHTRHLAMEQCPPTVACPEPAAISGGSLRRSTGAEAAKSQAMKVTSANQNTACRRWVRVMTVAPVKSRSGGERAGRSGFRKRPAAPKSSRADCRWKYR